MRTFFWRLERWYTETSSFHLPFDEVAITLHDMSNLLHLSIIDRFYCPLTVVDVDMAIDVIVELLALIVILLPVRQKPVGGTLQV